MPILRVWSDAVFKLVNKEFGKQSMKRIAES